MLDEGALVTHLVDTQNIGLVDLERIKISPLGKELGFDTDLCRATGTLPFDLQDGIVCVATIFYVSKPVVKHWEDLLKRRVLWYGTSIVALFGALETLAAPAPAAS